LHFELSHRRYAKRLAAEVRERTRELSESRAEIAREKERLAATLASIADGVVAVDAWGRVTLLNPAAEELAGKRERDCLGLPVERVLELSRVDGAPFDPAILRARGSSALDAVDLRIRSSAGVERTVELAVAPLVDRDRLPAGAVVALQDVSERRRLEVELARAQRLQSLGVLAGGIAHDFNNVLTAVGGHLGLYELEASIDARRNPRLRAAERALDRARELAEQLLTFARGGDPVRAPAAVDDLVLDAAQIAFSGSRVLWTTELPPDLWVVDVDKAQVRRVIENLLINARQALADGGRVRIGAQNVADGRKHHPSLQSARYVRLDVEDEGAGIAPENLERVFDPFFTTKAGGTGLGLATAYSVVHRHAGAITVRSRVGSGTTFSVYLPATDRPISERAPEQPARATTRARALLLDDQADVRDVLTGMLEHLGCDVVAVATEDEAVNAYVAEREHRRAIEISFLDLTLPDSGSGVEVARRIAELDPAAVLVAMSGYSDDPVLAHPERFGFRATLCKPFRLIDVSRALETLLPTERSPA
jgi:PAS domain S-box-containing protein